jgi:hypothetical protein
MTHANENRTLSEWINEMLYRRKLKSPDGRQLYKYRITEGEFNDLEFLLKLRILEWGNYYAFSELTKRPGFSALFVLYGAEWWRRRYDGSGFTWEGILRDLEIRVDGWNQSQRSDCVREGLRKWNLRTLEGSGFRFLGSVALQGGLPMKPLAQARGSIGQLLGRVLRAANNRLVDPTDIQNWVEDLQNWLPKSYRRAEIYILLADIAWTVLTLKQKAGLSADADAIARLDATVPGWREQFPLPIEDNQARLLIEQLVREAATVRLQKPTVCLPVERFLEASAEKEGEWEISSSVDLPDTLAIEKLAKLFEAESDELPRFAELSISVGSETRTARARKMAGNPSFRIEGATWDFSGEAALDEHLLKLSSTDGRVWMAPAMKGQPLENDLPWVFAVENSVNRFVRQGVGGVASSEAIVALPSDWKISEHSANAAQNIGKLRDFERDVYKITDAVFLENSDGASCKIKVQSVEEAAESFEWRGRRWWLGFLSPSTAFRGKPNLFRVDDSGNSVKISSAVTCAAIGGAVTNHWLGPVTLSYSSGGELKHKSRMTLLPEHAQLALDFGDALSGAIVFTGWELSRAIVKTPNVNFTQTAAGDSLTLNLSVSPEHRAPDQITVELFWRHTATPVRLNVPFPSKGCRAFDKNGNEISSRSLLAVNQILGTRLSVLTGGVGKKIKLKFQTNNGASSRKHYLQTLPGAVSLEVRLTDYLTDIDHLLSLDDSPDARVKIDLSIENAEVFTLVIARYAALIERGEDRVAMEIENSANGSLPLAELPVFAVCLEDPDEEPERLEFGGEIAEGKVCWKFVSEGRKCGSWLIFPGADSEINFRPTLWTIPGELDCPGELAQAINLANEYQRKDALKKNIKALAEDYAHSGWEEITRLAELVGHLPLTTLDLWRRFARSAPGMAALAFHYGKLPKGFISRFENELPFAWEAIPFSVWKKAIRQSFEYCRALFGEEVGKTIFEAHAQRRINVLTARHGGLSFLLGIAAMEFFPETQREAQPLRAFGEDLARQQLFFGENCHLMNLRRIHVEAAWAADTDNLLEKKWTNPKLTRFLHTENLGFQNAVINAPLLLAAEAALGDSASWLKDPAKIHLLRTFRAFDSEWFDEAYNWTLVRCLAHGLLDEQQNI